MVALAIKSFSGVSPRTPARYLQDSQAQVAINCPAFSGSLVPLPDVSTSVHTLTKSGTPTTIYRFGQGIQSDSQYWFHWATDVDVVRGPIAGDTSERTYFTGEGDYPKATDNSMALSGGTAYPIASYRLGVPAPTVAAVATVSGTGDATAVPETRVYTYTWVNSWNEESAPAGPSNAVDWTFGQTVTLSGLDAVPAGEYNIAARRIYRSVSGTYLFVAEIPVSANTFNDTVSPDDLAEELPSLTWDMPPAGLKGLVAGPNGVMAGFVGRDVYFCEPYRGFAWPVGFSQTVDYPVVGIGVMDTTFAVLTTGVPYFIQGTHPDSMAVVQSDIEQACVSKRSIVSLNGSVLYASPDGLVMLSSSGSKLITEQLFTRAQWQGFNPSSIHAYQHDMKYVAFYDTGAVQGGFIFDMMTGVFIMHDIYATAGYSDLQRDELFLAFANKTVKKWYGGTNKSYTWKSKKFTLPQIMGFSCAQLEAEAYPMTAKIYADGALIHTQAVTSRAPFRLPATTGRDWEVQIEGDKEVFSFVMAQSMQEISGA